jgi:Mce-associated membrane protein
VWTVVLLLAAAAACWTAWGAWDAREREAARTAGRAVAPGLVEKMLSYDHLTLDADVKGAEQVMTPSFADEYTRTMDLVREDAVKAKTSVSADSIVTSVVRGEREEVQALLFVNQTTTGAALDEPRVDLNRVLVTLRQDEDGTWLIADLQAL